MACLIRGVERQRDSWVAIARLVRVDEIVPAEGGLEAYISLFEADDPAVDRTAPDTDAELLSAGGGGASLLLLGTDDREGTLAYSYRLGGAGGWSTFSSDEVLVLEGLDPGVYELEVVARDPWLNVDESPLHAWLRIPADGEPEGCGGCSSRGGGSTLAASLLGLLALAALRRRE